MTNEEAHKIAELAVEFIDALESEYSAAQKTDAMRQNGASFAIALRWQQRATADEAIVKGIILELIDAVRGADNGS